VDAYAEYTSHSKCPSRLVAHYDPYGQVQLGAVGSFGFTGELQQGNNVYLRARWYNSAAGSFGSKDPLAGIIRGSYYAYASNNPINRLDPTGLKDHRYSTGGPYVPQAEMSLVRSKLKTLYPIASGFNNVPQTVEGNTKYETAFYAALGAGAAGYPNAARLLLRYLIGDGSETAIDLHSLSRAAPRSFRRAVDLEFASVVRLLEQSPPQLGTHRVYSNDATRRIRDDPSVAYPFILPEGGSVFAKESTDWFLAANDFAIWSDGTVTVSGCVGDRALYTVSLQFHFFDLYDWEPNPGEPEGVGVAFAPDAEMRQFFLMGLARYFYVRERIPLTITRDYLNGPSGIQQPVRSVGSGGGGSGAGAK
jgi:RHS repeat-associated protein